MLYLIPIIFIAFLLRSYGVNWDQGFHLHPDERALIMVTERIHFFDQLNPDFFNYGSLPIYLLKGVAQLLDLLFSTQFSSYQGMLYVGRYLSIFIDLGTIFLIYKIANILFSTDSTNSLQASSNNNEAKLRAKSRSLGQSIGLFSAFFYAIAFFPIQNSHFFVVDVFLTFFTTLLIYLLLKYISLPVSRGRTKLVISLGVIFAAMLSTKFTAIIFLPVILLVLILESYFSSGVENPDKIGTRLARTIKELITFNFLLLTFYFLFMPYAFIEYKKFIADISAQIKMNSDPYIFPYTLQYVGTLPYLYYLKNIFLWGLGPIISILSIIGLIKLGLVILSVAKNLALRILNKLRFTRSFVANTPQDDKKNNETMKQWINIFIFFLVYLFYFLIIGRSAVKFMRYMLPIYPFFTIMAGYGLSKISNIKYQIAKLFTFSFLLFTFIWSFMFINIYSQKHTRVAATEWILQNIPKGSTIALEHWDDGLPLNGGENYNFVEMTLYDLPDDVKKWGMLNKKLKIADYIIIASNRLYIPLQKLWDCKKYKSCYPRTAEYYRKLFSGENVILGRTEATTPESLLDSGHLPAMQSKALQAGAGMTEVRFKKVAEFAVFPGFRISNFEFRISDQGADESFTVYDHPKIIIFKNSYE